MDWSQMRLYECECRYRYDYFLHCYWYSFCSCVHQNNIKILRQKPSRMRQITVRYLSTKKLLSVMTFSPENEAFVLELTTVRKARLIFSSQIELVKFIFFVLNSCLMFQSPSSPILVQSIEWDSIPKLIENVSKNWKLSVSHYNVNINVEMLVVEQKENFKSREMVNWNWNRNSNQTNGRRKQRLIKFSFPFFVYIQRSIPMTIFPYWNFHQ